MKSGLSSEGSVEPHLTVALSAHWGRVEGVGRRVGGGEGGAACGVFSGGLCENERA